MKKQQKKSKKSKKLEKRKSPEKEQLSQSQEPVGPPIPDEILERAKAMKPMTKEEWEKKQSVIRRVYDEETGRNR